MKHLLPIPALVLLLLTNGCMPKGIQYNQPDFDNITKKTNLDKSYIIGMDDVLNIIIYEKWPYARDAYEKKVVVRDEGTIIVLPIGKIKVEGLTVKEAEEEVLKGLKTYLKKPFCEIEILEYNSKKICVLGNLDQAKVFGLKPGQRLVETVALAGGNIERRYLGPVKLVRKEKGEVRVFDINMRRIVVDGHLEEDVLLADGDILFVQESKLTEAKRIIELLTLWVPAYFAGRTLTNDFGVTGN